MKKLSILAVLTILLASITADARGKFGGRQARPHVLKYQKAKGWTQKIRVHSVRSSKSGKSAQVAVANKYGGKVRLYNVNKRTGRVSATRTGLTTQAKAMTKANRSFRRLNGTFAGAAKQGLSRSGKSYKFKHQTRNRRSYVTLKGGKMRTYKNKTLRRMSAQLR